MGWRRWVVQAGQISSVRGRRGGGNYKAAQGLTGLGAHPCLGRWDVALAKSALKEGSKQELVVGECERGAGASFSLDICLREPSPRVGDLVMLRPALSVWRRERREVVWLELPGRSPGMRTEGACETRACAIGDAGPWPMRHRPCDARGSVRGSGGGETRIDYRENRTLVCDRIYSLRHCPLPTKPNTQ